MIGGSCELTKLSFQKFFSFQSPSAVFLDAIVITGKIRLVFCSKLLNFLLVEKYSKQQIKQKQLTITTNILVLFYVIIIY